MASGRLDLVPTPPPLLDPDGSVVAASPPAARQPHGGRAAPSIAAAAAPPPPLDAPPRVCTPPWPQNAAARGGGAGSAEGEGCAARGAAGRGDDDDADADTAVRSFAAQREGQISPPERLVVGEWTSGGSSGSGTRTRPVSSVRSLGGVVVDDDGTQYSHWPEEARGARPPADGSSTGFRREPSFSDLGRAAMRSQQSRYVTETDIPGSSLAVDALLMLAYVLIPVAVAALWVVIPMDTSGEGRENVALFICIRVLLTALAAGAVVSQTTAVVCDARPVAWAVPAYAVFFTIFESLIVIGVGDHGAWMSAVSAVLASLIVVPAVALAIIRARAQQLLPVEESMRKERLRAASSEERPPPPAPSSGATLSASTLWTGRDAAAHGRGGGARGGAGNARGSGSGNTLRVGAVSHTTTSISGASSVASLYPAAAERRWTVVLAATWLAAVLAAQAALCSAFISWFAAATSLAARLGLVVSFPFAIVLVKLAVRVVPVGERAHMLFEVLSHSVASMASRVILVFYSSLGEVVIFLSYELLYKCTAYLGRFAHAPHIATLFNLLHPHEPRIVRAIDAEEKKLTVHSVVSAPTSPRDGAHMSPRASSSLSLESALDGGGLAVHTPRLMSRPMTASIGLSFHTAANVAHTIVVAAVLAMVRASANEAFFPAAARIADDAWPSRVGFLLMALLFAIGTCITIVFLARYTTWRGVEEPAAMYAAEFLNAHRLGILGGEALSVLIALMALHEANLELD